ncbi:MAG: glycosyltransferase, partial [Schaalia georgiae]|nr:glycosyltransferase [Schaalia georgiae]
MRILLVCSWYPSAERPFDGSFFAEQARMLSDSGLRVGVLALRQVRAEDPAWLVPPRATSKDGLVVMRASVPALPPGTRRLEPAVHAWVARRAARLVGAVFGVPDVLHAHTVFPGATVARGLARLWRRPYAITEHRPSTLDSPAFGARCRPITAAVAGAGALTTVSDGFARRLGEHYGMGEWEAVPLPVPALFFDEPLGGGAGSADGTGSADGAGAAGGARFVHVSHLDSNKRPGPMC